MEDNYFDNERFIESIERHPALWDKCCPEYSLKHIKEQNWKEVLQEMYGSIVSWDAQKLNDYGKL